VEAPVIAKALRVPLLTTGIALAFLAAMVLTGAMPEQAQLVKFEAKGLMRAAPEEITRVELSTARNKLSFTRASSSDPWIRDGNALPQIQADDLSMAVQMMNTSAPVKVLSPEELEKIDQMPFGLRTSPLIVSLYRAGTLVIESRFGNLNPEGYLQYVSLAGSPQVFLMSRFVGEQWRRSADASLAHSARASELAAPRYSRSRARDVPRSTTGKRDEDA
jgi:hypothetical protein